MSEDLNTRDKARRIIKEIGIDQAILSGLAKRDYSSLKGTKRKSVLDELSNELVEHAVDFILCLLGEERINIYYDFCTTNWDDLEESSHDLEDLLNDKLDEFMDNRFGKAKEDPPSAFSPRKKNQ